MLDLIRFAAVTGRVDPASPGGSRRFLTEELKKAALHIPDAILLPSEVLLPPSAGSLRRHGYLLDIARRELEALALDFQDLESLLLVGLPLDLGGVPVPAMALVRRGRVLGFVLPPDAPVSGPLPEGLFPAESLFSIGGCRTRILLCGGPSGAFRHAALLEGCDAVLLPCYEPARVGSFARAEADAAALSRAFGCAAVCCCGAGGDTSSPHAWKGWAVIAEAGETVSIRADFGQSAELVYDIDLDIVRAGRRSAIPAQPALSFPGLDRDYALRTFSSTPYLPMDPAEEERTLREWFALQAESLAARLQNTGLEKMLVGISGGLDSTLALLVCHRAAGLLRLDSRSVIAVTMPGFGTSDRTHYNALALPRELAMDTREIPIGPAVTQHLQDIRHPAGEQDVTYENAQARERTQILLDLANQEGGLVVGTGDLTEEALGWCTFGGDALANYNVNVTLPKTAIRRLIALCAGDSPNPRVREILEDVLATPVSPELLPTDESGAIVQKTEEILGDYEVHDFFLYYFIKYGFSPKKLLFYAKNAFDDRYGEERLRGWLKLFLRRFAGGQFKRSAAPEAAAITDFGLSSADFILPSDMSVRTLLKELDD